MIGIIGAMEEELRLLREAMKEVRTEKISIFEFYIGTLDTQPVVLLRCGIGKVNAAVGCTLLSERFKPRLVINTGSAGGITKRLHFGDVVIAQGLLYHDVDVTAFGYEPGQIPGQPAVFKTEDKFIALAEEATEELREEGRLPQDLRHVRGLIGSGDIFMHEEEKISILRQRFPEIAAVEMEGAAIAHCCMLFKIPFLIIRALSDIAGAESPVTSEEFLSIASRHSSELVRRIIRKGI